MREKDKGSEGYMHGCARRWGIHAWVCPPVAVHLFARGTGAAADARGNTAACTPEATSATHAFVNALLVVEKPGLAGAGALCLYALLTLFVLAKLSKTALVAGSVHLGLGVHRLISLAQG